MPVTRDELAADLRALGVRAGAIVMAHTSMRSLGRVVGGSRTVIEALLDAVGPEGTICAQVSWEAPDEWEREHGDAFPPFDPARTAAAPYEGRIPERLRTWPGACRSANPATGIAAVGRDAAPLTAGHRLDDGFGAGTPYARLVAARGQVVLLGAPLHTISLLHHAEALARGPKRWTAYEAPLPGRGWVRIRELDVWRGVFPYEVERPLGVLAAEALAAGAGRTGAVGAARSHVFGAAELTRFAVQRLERRWPPAARG